MNYKVLVTDQVSDSGLKQLYDHPGFIVDKQTGLEPHELKKVIKDYDALIVRSQTNVTEEILEAAERLRIVARAGVGVDNINVDAATKKGIIVINAPGANTIAATEHTLAMMLSLARQIPLAHQSTSGGKWERKAFKGVELYQKTLGIIGMGRIGTEVAKRAKGFQMSILGFDPYLTEDRAKKLGITKASLDDIAQNSDFITVHTPLTHNTKALVNKEYLQKVKEGVRIINCARGGIIDEAALIEAIKEGRVAGAALDVYEQEPPANPDLLESSKVIVTPHLGASTQEAQEKVAQEVSAEIIEIFEKQSVHHAVNLPQVSGHAQQRMKPYLQVGEQMAQLLIQLFKQAPERIEIEYCGDLLEEDTGLLTRTLIKGILSYHLSDSVNIINVLHLLKDQGLVYNVQKNAKRKGFSNYMELTLINGGESVNIGATVLNGYGPRIVTINGYRVDLKPEADLLYIKHHDLPGVIGQVGSILGNYHINIGTMQVGRTSIGGEAIMLLTLDKKANDEVIDTLLLLSGLQEAQMLNLESQYAMSDEVGQVNIYQ
ncbi:D-3-phosphoglycerate dehydrogenase [Scopulibacillus darangshiensis]|uniref:D-3-phosphoglycerate dehydrogenase n=1 Tax=Scopulibacillus darangshiensis TaxID=442528 RepID=A0A4R2P467_9BACL|nr:phosphoglycerate dehydrogenase [Scopulibacillus darangshiensis]TCP28938.1 D-3-phosphoglycerate dehydrogenase [Scopulibacillus darangshiensis]